jgi:hypothetical protein
MTPEQLYRWKIALELKLRKCSGTAFQDFFADVMAAKHGSDYVRVRPYGPIGDKGCDGYLQPTGDVFACYGALNGDGGKVGYLIGKMGEDYGKAVTSLSGIMAGWYMVHNLVDGLPTEAILKLNELKAAEKDKIQFGFKGLEAFEEIVFSLPKPKIEALLGMAAKAHDSQNLQTAELRDLVAAIMAAADAMPIDVTQIRPVSPDKLSFNKLPSHWQSLIANGWQNAHFVEEYLERHPDPMTGETMARAFRARYEYLKAQGLEPGAIMIEVQMVKVRAGLWPHAIVIRTIVSGGYVIAAQSRLSLAALIDAHLERVAA